jgi:hypothetical protein
MSDDFAMVALFVLSVSCALLLCALPRALVPTDGPGLRLSRSEVEEVMSADAQAERKAKPTRRALELDRLRREQGEAEARTVEVTTQRAARKRALHKAFEELISEEGDEAAVAQRALALSRFEAALDLRLPDEQRKGVMGLFANVLARHRVTHDGVPLAPHFVLRTLYKARWNIFAGVAADWAFTKVEKRAHHGWLALHAENVDVRTRLASLAAYAAAGGTDEPEARGMLLFRAGDYTHAAEAFGRAYAATGNLRMRNYQRGAAVAADTASGASEEHEAPAN